MYERLSMQVGAAAVDWLVYIYTCSWPDCSSCILLWYDDRTSIARSAVFRYQEYSLCGSSISPPGTKPGTVRVGRSQKIRTKAIGLILPHTSRSVVVPYCASLLAKEGSLTPRRPPEEALLP